MDASSLRRDLGDGLVLRWATADDVERLAAFDARALSHEGPETPDLKVAATVHDLMDGGHPTCTADHFTLVEDSRTGNVVSSMVLIPQTWTYEGIPFEVGRIELVGTDPAYRKRGLVRAQFEAVHQRCAQLGHLVQGITGIPYFYRQFGYEMALVLGGDRVGYESHVPKLKEGQPETYRVRPAVEADVPFIASVYSRAMERYTITCARDEALWRYEIAGRRQDSWERIEIRVVETADGEPVGFLAHATALRWGRIRTLLYELEPGTSWLAVTPSVIRYLWAAGRAYAVRDGDEMGGFSFLADPHHPVIQAAKSRLPHVHPPYAWYVRVGDLPGFLRHVTPVLERRLAASVASGYTGELQLNFFRDGLRLVFEAGRVSDVTPWLPEDAERGGAAFPGLTFLQLVFGYRSLDDLRQTFPDCWVDGDEARALLEALFPRRPSRAWGLE